MYVVALHVDSLACDIPHFATFVFIIFVADRSSSTYTAYETGLR